MTPARGKPPLLLETEMEKTPKAFRKPTPAPGSRWWRGGRSKAGSRVKGVLTRPLTRFCGAIRWSWRATAVAGVHQGELGERSEPNARQRGGKTERRRRRLEAEVGWAEQNRVKVERAYSPGP